MPSVLSNSHLCELNILCKYLVILDELKEPTQAASEILSYKVTVQSTSFLSLSFLMINSKMS